jgi:hypothetical protein
MTNGNIIGAVNAPTRASAPGVWDLRSQLWNTSEDRWPGFADAVGLVSARINGSTSLVISNPTQTIKGDLLVALVGRQNSSASDNNWTGPAGWTEAADLSNIGLFYKIATDTEPLSYTFTCSVTQSAGFIRVFRKAVWGGFYRSPDPFTSTTTFTFNQAPANALVTVGHSQSFYSGLTMTGPTGTGWYNVINSFNSVPSQFFSAKDSFSGSESLTFTVSNSRSSRIFAYWVKDSFTG